MSEASDPATDSAIESAAAWLAEADSVLFITGAGVSADSGLPTYRGVGGLYEDTPVEEGMTIEQALSGSMFKQRPDLTWRYIRQIEEACRGAGCNRAHQVMAEIEKTVPRTWILTQNVDGLHRAAGSEKVIPIHGDVHDLDCTACEWTTAVDHYGGLEPLPKCPRCGSVVRPRVVLFGEWLPQRAVAQLHTQLEQGFDLVFSVGTSSLFPYIAQPVVQADLLGARSVEINPGETPVSDLAHLRLRLGAAEAMDRIWSRAGELRTS